MKQIKLKSLLENTLDQHKVNKILNVAKKYSNKNILGLNNIEYPDLDHLIKSIKSSGYIPDNKWDDFIYDVVEKVIVTFYGRNSFKAKWKEAYIYKEMLDPNQEKEIEKDLGYVKAYGKYWEIIKIYPKQKKKEVTFDGPEGLEVVGFHQLQALPEKHKGEKVWRKI